jgi:hypothetical protein
MIGVDLNKHSLERIDSVIKKILTSKEYDFTGVHIFTCEVGREMCSLHYDEDLDQQKTIFKAVPMIPIDSLLDQFESDHPGFLPSRAVAGAGDDYYNPLIDILMIDVEGNDVSTMQGAQKRLATKHAPCLMFEHHSVKPWSSFRIEDVVNQQDAQGCDCYSQGVSLLCCGH